ncbi:MAG: hypothetical protein GY861_07940, partial [bacterium]|nr:hypothetical protein [bacterium]
QPFYANTQQQEQQQFPNQPNPTPVAMQQPFHANTQQQQEPQQFPNQPTPTPVAMQQPFHVNTQEEPLTDNNQQWQNQPTEQAEPTAGKMCI